VRESISGPISYMLSGLRLLLTSSSSSPSSLKGLSHEMNNFFLTRLIMINMYFLYTS
jgi:hypothetical protein